MSSKEETPPVEGGGAGAFTFISKGWREVRDSASADLRLMRARAEVARARADRELEHLLASASALAPALPPVATEAPIAEVEFMHKRIQPKIQELRRQYSSRTALDARWPAAAGAGGASSLRIDLSGITAMPAALEADGENGEARGEDHHVSVGSRLRLEDKAS